MNDRITVRVCVYSTSNPIYDFIEPSLAEVPHIGDTLSFYPFDGGNIEKGKVIGRDVYYINGNDRHHHISSVYLTVKFPVEKWLHLWNDWCNDNSRKSYDKMVRGSNKFLWNMSNKGDVAFLLRHTAAFGLDNKQKLLLEAFMNSKNPNEKYYE